ncbi:AUGMIN subunit 3 [Camellia lanceoleosa]|uniref:AUGMIN subunit 3 n=1 Tax=Camellia lanceoleosa TaxID=1840588 RepID=A0ACC0HR73_9ERIC|nr:AUGMIN subunit 3 [Camellia lanceoleosa]
MVATLCACTGEIGPIQVVFAKVIYSRMQKDIYISDSRQRIVSSHLMDTTLTYKAEALELQRQLRQLQTQYDMLSSQASTLIQGRRARVAASSVLKNTNVRLKDTVNQIPLLDLMESFPFVPAKVQSKFLY